LSVFFHLYKWAQYNEQQRDLETIKRERRAEQNGNEIKKSKVMGAAVAVQFTLHTISHRVR